MADNAFDRVESASAEVVDAAGGAGWLEHAATSSAAAHTTPNNHLV
ncbi:hypothetical protein [Mycobacterium sp. 4858]|nr:hypothetical protein [Mycobacterium sp. 4858]